MSDFVFQNVIQNISNIRRIPTLGLLLDNFEKESLLQAAPYIREFCHSSAMTPIDENIPLVSQELHLFNTVNILGLSDAGGLGIDSHVNNYVEKGPSMLGVNQKWRYSGPK